MEIPRVDEDHNVDDLVEETVRDLVKKYKKRKMFFESAKEKGNG